MSCWAIADSRRQRLLGEPAQLLEPARRRSGRRSSAASPRGRARRLGAPSFAGRLDEPVEAASQLPPAPLVDDGRKAVVRPPAAPRGGRRSRRRAAADRGPGPRPRTRRGTRSPRRGRGARRARRPGALTRFSARRQRFGGKQASKISIAARSRRVATRMSWTRSMSPVSSTPRECSKISSARTAMTRAAASANGASQSKPGSRRAEPRQEAKKSPKLGELRRRSGVRGAVRACR